MTLDEVLDILHWFNSPTAEYIDHILVAKLDGEERVRRALPTLRKEARALVKRYKDTDIAYPA